MAIPAAPANQTASYCRCHAGDFSRATVHLRAAYTLNIQTTILGTGLGFRTFRSMRQVLFTPLGHPP